MFRLLANCLGSRQNPLTRSPVSEKNMAVSGGTKTNTLVETLVSDDSNYIASQMPNQPFNVATGGSNGMDNMMLYLVTVRYVYLHNFFTLVIMWDFSN